MEYRFFYSINEHLFHSKWSTRTNVEHRSDIYVLVPSYSDEFHLEHGLKLRKQKNLELKKREKRFANGQEYWIKTIHSEKKIHIDDINSILKILAKSNENQLIERL